MNRRTISLCRAMNNKLIKKRPQGEELKVFKAIYKYRLTFDENGEF